MGFDTNSNTGVQLVMDIVQIDGFYYLNWILVQLYNQLL